MNTYRNVSESNAAEASEVLVNGVIFGPNDKITISTTSTATWPTEVDFITYARDVDGDVDEDTRVVWSGTKQDDTHIEAQRTGGSPSYVPDSTNMATVVPTHKWANDIVNGIRQNLASDGEMGINTIDGIDPIVISIGQTEPQPIPNRTILWLRPLN